MALPDASAGSPVVRIRKFHIVACNVLWREFCHLASLSPHAYTFEFLRQGLHDTPDILRRELQAAVDRAPDGCEAVLVGYGLCSNGIAGIRAVRHPLVLMRGHDCITFLLGSRELYARMFRENPGTYWYSSGWIETSLVPGPVREKTLRERYAAEYGPENADFLMESERSWMKNYSRAVFIETRTGAGRSRAGGCGYAQSCAKRLGWKFEVKRGNPGLMRDFVEGRWEGDRFILVPPGGELAASHDEGIVRQVRTAGT